MSLRNALLTALLLVIISGSSSAALVLDQGFELGPTDANSFYFLGSWYRAQTFTVGASGTLSRVDVFLAGSGEAQFEIWNTSAGVPDTISSATPLASWNLSFSTLPFYPSKYHASDISGFGVQVNAGDVLALVQVGGALSPTTDAAWSGASRFSTNGGYQGGSIFTTTSSPLTGAWLNDVDSDLGFRTFVDTVPEPTSLAIWGGLSMAGMVCGVFRRRRNRKP